MRGRRALPSRRAEGIHAEAEAPWSTKCAAKNPARIRGAHREIQRPAIAEQFRVVEQVGEFPALFRLFFLFLQDDRKSVFGIVRKFPVTPGGGFEKSFFANEKRKRNAADGYVQRHTTIQRFNWMNYSVRFSQVHWRLRLRLRDRGVSAQLPQTVQIRPINMGCLQLVSFGIAQRVNADTRAAFVLVNIGAET